jgi:hypothetical protein
MKIRLLLLILIVSVLTPVNADAFFNRDCANLKKRVTSNQLKYEIAWDKYQVALGKFKAISNPTSGADQEVANRLRVTYKAIENILNDMDKFPKCLAKPHSKIKSDLAYAKSQQWATYQFRYGTAPEAELFNFLQYLK